MWKQLLAPLGLVIVIWISISLWTTVFIANSDRDYQKLLGENVAAIEAAGDLRALTWKLMVSLGNSSGEDAKTTLAKIEPIAADFFDAAARLKKFAEKAATANPEEATLLKKIEEWVDHLTSLLQERRFAPIDRPLNENTEGWKTLVSMTAPEIAHSARTISRLNREFIDSFEKSRKTQLSRLLFLRNVTLFLGPLLGIALGWQMTNRLQRRFSTLAITLQKAADQHTFKLGEVSLKGSDKLSDAQTLSEQVLKRLNQIAKDLDQAERKVIQSERLAALGELAAGVAHELRNPLTSVKLLLQYAAQNPNSSEKGSIELENLSLVLHEIGRMEETIQGLLDFARPCIAHFAHHDVRMPLERAVTLIRGRAKAEEISIVYNRPEEPIWLNGDSEHLHLVFVNLLINAIESIESGGTVLVEATAGTQPSTVEISFRDTGCGIPSEIRDRIFEPFVTTKEHGTGLGLALCHRIVSSHEGRIRGENIDSGGAVFKLVFPVVSPITCVA